MTGKRSVRGLATLAVLGLAGCGSPSDQGATSDPARATATTASGLAGCPIDVSEATRLLGHRVQLDDHTRDECSFASASDLDADYVLSIQWRGVDAPTRRHARQIYRSSPAPELGDGAEAFSYVNEATSLVGVFFEGRDGSASVIATVPRDKADAARRAVEQLAARLRG